MSNSYSIPPTLLAPSSTEVTANYDGTLTKWSRLDDSDNRLCEVCEEREHTTLSSDGHPEGVNLLICEECAL